MSPAPTSAEKGLVLNVRTGAVYGAAAGFAVGLAWQCWAGYKDPLALWRACLLVGTLAGGGVGLTFVLAKRATRSSESETTTDPAQ